MLPLAGRRILVTRAREQSSALAEALAREGAEVISIPAIELAPPSSWCALDAALTVLPAYDWLVFTSANAVSTFSARARKLGLPAAPRRVAVIGPATERAVVVEGIAARVDLRPDRFVAEALVAALEPEVRGGAEVLVVRAAEARDVLVDGLEAAGARVTVAVAYRTVVPPGSVDALRTLLVDGRGLDAVLFTSGSSVKNLHGLLEAGGLGLPEATILGSIGPVTSATVRELGRTVTLEAREATLESLVSGLVAHYAR